MNRFGGKLRIGDDAVEAVVAKAMPDHRRRRRLHESGRARVEVKNNVTKPSTPLVKNHKRKMERRISVRKQKMSRLPNQFLSPGLERRDERTNAHRNV